MSFVRYAIIAGVLTVLGCSDGGSGASSSGAGGSGAAGGAGASGGSGGTNAGAGGTGGQLPIGCEPQCVPPQFCSATNECIDEGTCKDDADCSTPGTICDLPTSTCVPGGGCEDLTANIEPVPPNLLIVLDRSCSMTGSVGGGVTKWEAAVAALNTLTTTYAGQIRFGLTMFPDTVAPSCAQDVIPIPLAPGNELAIQTLLNAALVNNDPNFPNGPCVTNIDTAIEQAAAAPELQDPTRDSYVALITDGNQAGCNQAGGDMGTLQIVTDLFAEGIPTFVVGFGAGIDPTQLNLFAIAGGVPNTMPSYYDAGDQMSLEVVLEAIATAAISCTFTLDTAPPNPSQIYVFFDNVPVPEDPTMMTGWSFDPVTNQVTFHGADCDLLKGGTVMEVDVVLGCDVPD